MRRQNGTQGVAHETGECKDGAHGPAAVLYLVDQEQQTKVPASVRMRPGAGKRRAMAVAATAALNSSVKATAGQVLRSTRCVAGAAQGSAGSGPW